MGTFVKRYSLLVVAAAIVVVLGYLGLQDQGPLAQFLHDEGGEAVASSPESDRGSGTTTSTQIELDSRGYQAGDCVTWDQSAGRGAQRRTDVVDCAEPHLIEMTTGALLDPSGYGPDGPTEAEWDVVIERECTPRAADHLGYALDAEGRYTATAITPTPESWRRGEHDLQCGIGHVVRRVPPAENPSFAEPFTGPVAGTDQTLLYGPDTCLDSASGPAYVVDCSAPHSVEVVGAVQLLGSPGSPYPGEEAVAAAIDEKCSEAVADAFGGAIPGDVGIGYYGLTEGNWLRGGRVVECTIGRPGPDGTWQTVEGSIRSSAEA